MTKKPFENNTNSSSNKKKTAGSELSGTPIRIKDYNPSKHLLKVVRVDNGEPLEEDLTILGEDTQVKPYEQVSSKCLKTSEKQDGPILQATDDAVSMRGSKESGFYSFAEHGNIITGPLSIAAAPQDIRLSGVNTLNPLITSGFPSTIVTPIPATLISIPGGAAMKQIAKDVVLMSILVAAMGV